LTNRATPLLFAKRVRKRDQESNSADEDDVEKLIRERQISRLYPGIKADDLIKDEVLGDVVLPDFEAFGTKRTPSAPLTPTELKSKALLRGLTDALNPQPENPRPSDDFFDKGPGLLVKQSVFACCALAALWEVYLGSPFFDRKAPMVSIVQVLEGAPLTSAPTRAESPTAKLVNKLLE
jgi:hypothetical protein